MKAKNSTYIKYKDYYKQYYQDNKKKMNETSNKRYHKMKEIFEAFREQLENKHVRS